MQAQLFFEGTQQGVRWREVALPGLDSDSDALVRPLAVARCDFDAPYLFDKLHLMLRMGLRANMVDEEVPGYFGPEPFAPPFAVGHEFVAEVVRCGSAVHGFSAGDRVIVPFQVSCGSCAACLRGASGSCSGVRAGSVFGFGERGGRFGGAVCDLVRIPFAQHLLVKLPAALSPVTMACAGDNLTVAFQGVVPGLRARPDAKVLVLGGGCASIGLYAVGFACAQGSDVTYVDTDHDQRAATRRLAAERLGARAVLTLDQLGSDARYDLCVDASSSAEALQKGLRSLRVGGECNCIGLHFGASVRLPLFPMCMRGITLRTGWGNPREDIEAMLTHLARSSFDPSLIVSQRADWAEAESAWLEPGTKLVIARAELKGETTCTAKSTGN